MRVQVHFRFVPLISLAAVLAPVLTPCVRSEENVPAIEVLKPQAFDRGAAAHLLSRAGFGGTPEEIDRLVTLGFEKAIESLFEPEGEDAVGEFQPTLTERPSPRELAGLSREERQKKTRELRGQDNQQFQLLRAWWLRRMVLTGAPLREKMTLFWHGHFATSQRDVRNSYHMYLQNRTLRSKAFSNFKDLVTSIAKDPAMLRYLDNNRNIRGRPNENFARELMELFTLGIGHYTEVDIQEAARALTGWTFRENEFIFAQRAHDPGEKTFLGKKGRFDGDDIIDIIFEQPAASRFVVRKLFEYFAHDEPSEAIIEALAATFRSSGFEVRPVLLQLFRSAEFYSPRSRGTRVKSPVELVAGTLRLLKIDPRNSPAPVSIAGRMGQDILLPPNVKGWEEGESWISTTTLFDRYNFARPLLGLDGPAAPQRGGKRNIQPGAFLRNLPQWNVKEGARQLLGENAEKLAPGEVVDRLLKTFLLVPIGNESREELKTFYEGANPKVRLQELIHLILSSPQYQLG